MFLLILYSDIQRASLVLTYPHLDTSDPAGVMSFYGQPNNMKGLEMLNETCTAKRDESDRLDFSLKLTRLVKGKSSEA